MSKVKKTIEIESDSDASDVENITETSVDVGYIEEEFDDLTAVEKRLNKTLLRSPFFASKLGGKPAWLNQACIPLAVGTTFISNNNDSVPPPRLQCKNCKSQLRFLLQIYAPISSSDKMYDYIENIDDTFHRVLYVFLCANTECLPASSRGLHVFRSQLRRTNDFFSSDPPPAFDSEDDAENLKLADAHLASFYKSLYEKNLFNLCTICGLVSTKKCAKCSFCFYCDQQHQILDWTQRNHKGICSSFIKAINSNDTDELMKAYIENENAPSNEENNNLFPEYEILIEPEVLDFKKDHKEKDFKYDEEKLAMDLDCNLNIEKDLDNVKESECDKDFDKFNKITKDQATQIVRYDKGGTPLWVTKYLKLKKESNIPSCSHCGAKRVFEFQINPQLLCYLNIDEGKQVNSLDWAGLYVYTCGKSCSAANKSYVEEYIYKQDFVN